MTTNERTPPAPFTSEDYAARMRRVVADAVTQGWAVSSSRPVRSWCG